MIGLFALACDLVGLPRVPERRPDYTVTLAGQSYGLSDESDQDAPLIVWTGESAPACPSCSEPLVRDGEEDTNAAPVEWYSAWRMPELRCNCGACFEMRDAR